MQEIQHALSEPFDPDEIEWKPQSVKDNRALAVAFVNSRVVMDRLDKVLGVGGWQTSYRELGSGVVCVLRIKVGDEWIVHEDVGSFSDQSDAGDKLKAAFSDALKRVAIHVGVGRYLYALPKQWCDYDPKRRQFVKVPTLPSWAFPRPTVISAAQRGTVEALLDDTGADVEAFCKHFGCPSVKDLPAARFDEAVALLQKKRNGKLPKPESMSR
jgi:hypothetical protein